MSFTIGEANYFYALLRWLLPQFNHGSTPVTDDQARDALAYLAYRARKSLSAGPTGDEVDAAWPPPRLDVEHTEVEWCAFYGGEDPGNAAGTHRWIGEDGQAEAEERAQWLIESGVARRTVTYGPWEIQPLDDDDEPSGRAVTTIETTGDRL